LKELEGKPEHQIVQESEFIMAAASILVLPQLASTRLYDRIKACLVVEDDEFPPQKNSKEMLSMKNLKLLVDLYQFLPSKKGTEASVSYGMGLFTQ